MFCNVLMLISYYDHTILYHTITYSTIIYHAILLYHIRILMFIWSFGALISDQSQKISDQSQPLRASQVHDLDLPSTQP